jgi:hypothetical protein
VLCAFDAIQNFVHAMSDSGHHDDYWLPPHFDTTGADGSVALCCSCCAFACCSTTFRSGIQNATLVHAEANIVDRGFHCPTVTGLACPLQIAYQRTGTEPGAHNIALAMTNAVRRNASTKTTTIAKRVTDSYLVLQSIYIPNMNRSVF